MLGYSMDFQEDMEYACEERYYNKLQSDGKSLKCDCGNIFNPEKEGGPVTSNPYSDFVCNECLECLIKNKKEYGTEI